MKCQRLTCQAAAEVRVRIRFLSGRVVSEDLCGRHGHAFYSALLAAPQTESGSSTPIPRAAAKGVAA